jgi:hypothetical protein
MVNVFWLLLPDAGIPLVILVLCIGVMIGVVRPRTVIGVVAGVVASFVAAPLIESLFASLPMWVGLVTLAVVGLWVVRTILEALLGREAAGHVLGALVIATARTLVRVALIPIRVSFRAVRAITERRA